MRSPPPAPNRIIAAESRPPSAALPGGPPISAMDSPPPATLEYEIVAVSGDASTEDYVHVSGSSPAHEPLPPQNLDGSSVSIVGVVDQLGSDDGSGSCGDGDPEELMKNVVLLSCESSAEGGSCDVYLVGTAHVSQESCREVQALVSSLKPQVVFLELCSSRVSVLTPQNLKIPTMGEMVDLWRKKHNLFGIIYSWFLAKVASKLEVFPGSEFRVAYEEAMKYGGRVILGDRPVQITLWRTWGSMPLWHKAKLLYSLFFQAVFLPSPEDLNKMLKEMDDVDALTLVIQEMSKEFPTLMETLVNERDRFMSATLLNVASEQNSVVAVVGKGHVRGIVKHWMQPIELRDLLENPTPKSTVSATNIFLSIGAAVVGVAIVSGFILAAKK